MSEQRDAQGSIVAIDRDTNPQFFELLIEHLKKDHHYDDEKINSILKTDENIIPLSIYNGELSTLESVVKYLKENLKFSFSKISVLLNRAYSSIYITYKHSSKKLPNHFIIKQIQPSIPISEFSERKFSVLETAVVYLKSQNLKFHEIAKILHRDNRTIWTVYHRAIKKGKL